MKKEIYLLLILFVTAGLTILIIMGRKKEDKIRETVQIIPKTGIIPTNVPRLSPTTKVLSFQELNNRYGPCAKVKVLMYHHIEDDKTAKANHRDKLAVNPENFRKHLEYLKSKEATSILPIDLVNFFDLGKELPNNPIMITLDDAYEDNYSQMWPILKEFGFKAVIFTPTGLVQNPDYLSWQEIEEMSQDGLVYFGNHTWSHHSSAGAEDVLRKEIDLADKQLDEKGQNREKVFAYPFGQPSKTAEKILRDFNYQLAFTTSWGNVVCKGKRLELPRIRVGNSPLLSKFGV